MLVDNSKNWSIKKSKVPAAGKGLYSRIKIPKNKILGEYYGKRYTAKEYSDNGMPWFDYYDEKASSLSGSKKLSHLKSITEKAKEKRDDPLPENESANPKHVIKIRKGLKKNQVREGSF